MIERLSDRIMPVPESGCWLWMGSHDPKGYGRIIINRRRVPLHRVVFEQLYGPIPEGKQIDHLCRVKSCINPNHLEIVESRTNTLRGIGPTALNAQKTHCHHGHPFDLANTIFRRTGGRRCRQCRKEDLKRELAKKK